MNIYNLMEQVNSDDKLKKYQDFLSFARQFVKFVNAGKETHPNIQAEIVSKNESNYHFFQYKDDGAYCVTRPINTNLFLAVEDIDAAFKLFEESITDVRAIKDDFDSRNNINKVIYTCQQAVGCTLDAFNNPNKARKKNGTFFEIFVRDVINATGMTCASCEETLPINADDSMRFQHDLVIFNPSNEPSGIGQIKTSSKDRLDKIFLDRMMYANLKDTDIPYFAIFLNDVQRSSRRDGAYAVNSTFLPGHFKAYTMALSPLNGVYYFDLRQQMESDGFLSKRIFRFDKFIVEDMWDMVKK